MKKVLEDMPHLTGLHVAENGDWYFEKPSNVETEFKSRDEILEVKKKTNDK